MKLLVTIALLLLHLCPLDQYNLRYHWGMNKIHRVSKKAKYRHEKKIMCE